MGGDTIHPLTPDEAKARLRASAQEVSLGTWVGQHKWAVLSVALAGGFFIGRVGIPIAARAMLIRQVTPILLTLFIRGKRP